MRLFTTLLTLSLLTFASCRDGNLSLEETPLIVTEPETETETIWIPTVSFVEYLPPPGTLNSIEFGQLWTPDGTKIADTDKIYCDRRYVWSVSSNISMNFAEFNARGFIYKLNINAQIINSINEEAAEINISALGSSFAIEFLVNCSADFKARIESATNEADYPFLELTNFFSQYYVNRETISEINGSLKIYPSLLP